MSHNTESVMSSAVSVSGVESLLDDASTVSVENRTGMSRSSANELFDLGDGDLHIIVNGKTLETHKFLIKRFANLKGWIKNGAVTLEAGGPEAEDFSNTFNILYASVIEGPCNFDQTTLISALLVATRYDYPALRTFAISKLEKAELSAVERIRLARKFNIPSWEEPAFLELCERDEAITMSEAEVLGLETIVHLGRIREKEQRRRGKEVDAAEELKNEPKAQADGPEVIETPNTPVKIEYAAPTVAPSSLDNATATEGEGIEITAGTALKPCFIDFPPPSAQTLDSSYAYRFTDRIELDLPGCKCSAYSTLCQRKLPPCAVSAFKHLQTQQLAYNINISALETTVGQIQAAMTTLTPAVKHLAEANPLAHIQPGSLRDDVQKWLACNKSGVTIL